MSKEASSTTPAPWQEWLSRLVWVGFFGLFAAAWLFPAEGSVGIYAGVPLAFGWLLLGLLLTVTLTWLPTKRWAWSWCDVLVAAFLIWTAVATWVLVASEQVYARAAVNLAVQFWGLGFVYGLGRVGFSSPESSRWILTIIVSGVTFLAATGLYEYGLEMPQVRRDYFNAPESEKQQQLAGAGVSDTSPDSRERRLFENRFSATEPLATFAHTNSLAIVLGVGIAILLFWSLPCFVRQEKVSWLWISLLIFGLLLTLGVLVLTKSRTSWLALLLVVVACLIIGRPNLKTIGFVAAGGLVMLTIGGVLMLSGVLDIEVVSESLKSLSYRFEYWRSAAAMIGSEPIWGVGLGTFQDRYPLFKLPQASETVADPHNLFVEAAATLGIPALLLVGSIAGWVVFDVFRTTDVEADEVALSYHLPGADVLALCIGGVLALVLGLMLPIFSGLVPLIIRWSVAIVPAIAVGVACYHSLPLDRQMLRRLLGVGLAVWTLGQLAAGGFSSWNVAQLGWLLLGGWVSCSPAQNSVGLSR